MNDVTIKKNDEIDAEQARSFDKIISSPGPATPMDSGNLLSIIKLLAPTHSILGICLGHQAIAECYGAKLINVPKPFHGFRTEIEISKQHKLFSFLNLGDKMNVGLYHSWIVDEEKFPSELEITSKSKEGYIMSLRHKKFDVHGVQFHPESYMSDFGKELIANFLKN